MALGALARRNTAAMRARGSRAAIVAAPGRARPGAHLVAGGHSQHVLDLAAFQVARRPGSAPYTSSPVTQPAGVPPPARGRSSRRASSGLVANSVPSGMPAAAAPVRIGRPGPGRYSSRSISACPAGEA